MDDKDFIYAYTSCYFFRGKNFKYTLQIFLQYPDNEIYLSNSKANLPVKG